MGTPFLDTSVIVCSFSPYESHKNKATEFVNKEYLISPIVHEEIKRIKIRRFAIYTSILNFLQTLEKSTTTNLTFEDVYKRCFKVNYGKNYNDNRHLDTIFGNALAELSLDRTTNLSLELLNNFAIKVDDVFNEIRFGALQITSFLDNPLNYQNRVVKPDVGKKFNKLHTLFKKIRDYNQHKNDVDILIHGVEHSCYTNTNLDIISNDNYQVSISGDVKRCSLSVFPKLYFDIFHLSRI